MDDTWKRVPRRGAGGLKTFYARISWNVTACGWLGAGASMERKSGVSRRGSFEDNRKLGGLSEEAFSRLLDAGHLHFTVAAWPTFLAPSP